MLTSYDKTKITCMEKPGWFFGGLMQPDRGPTVQNIFDEIERRQEWSWFQERLSRFYVSKSTVIIIPENIRCWFPDMESYSVYEKPWLEWHTMLKNMIIHDFRVGGACDIVALCHPSFQLAVMLEVLDEYKKGAVVDLYAPGYQCCERVNILVEYVCSGSMPKDAESRSWLEYYIVTGQDKDVLGVMSETKECELHF